MELKNHLSNHCKHCDSFFRSKNDLNEHLISHAKNQSYRYNICSKTFPQGEKLKQHRKIHDTTVTTVFVCKYCGKRFDTLFKLKINLVHHSDESAFSCGEFKKCFSFKAELENHTCKPVKL